MVDDAIDQLLHARAREEELLRCRDELALALEVMGDRAQLRDVGGELLRERAQGGRFETGFV